MSQWQYCGGVLSQDFCLICVWGLFSHGLSRQSYLDAERAPPLYITSRAQWSTALVVGISEGV